MKFRPFKMCSLNESLLKEDKEEAVEVVGAGGVDYADAINQRETTKEVIKTRFEEFNKLCKEFIDKNHNREVKGETTMEMKKMHLAESVEYGDPNKDFGTGHCAPTIPNFKRDIENAVKYLGTDDDAHAKTFLKGYVHSLIDAKQSVENFNAYWTERYPALIDYIDSQITIVPYDTLKEVVRMDEALLDVDIPITANVDAHGSTVSFLGGTAKTEDVDPDLFQVELEECALTESPAAVAEPETKKKRFRGPNEKPDIADYSSEDLWYAVYDELSATTDNEGEGKVVNKQMKARRGERYNNVYPHGDHDIVVYATKPEEFDFAKKVADHYGVVAEEPKEDGNKATNSFYKYSMVIRIPEEGLYSA